MFFVLMPVYYNVIGVDFTGQVSLRSCIFYSASQVSNLPGSQYLSDQGPGVSRFCFYIAWSGSETENLLVRSLPPTLCNSTYRFGLQPPKAGQS